MNFVWWRHNYNYFNSIHPPPPSLHKKMCARSYRPNRKAPVDCEVHRSLHISGFSIWNFSYFAVVAVGIWRWLLDFWESCVPLCSSNRIGQTEVPDIEPSAHTLICNVIWKLFSASRSEWVSISMSRSECISISMSRSECISISMSRAISNSSWCRVDL